MPGRVSVEVVWSPGVEIVAQTYFTMSEKSAQLRNPTEEAARVALDQIDLNFQVEGRPVKWAALTAETMLVRAALGFPAGPILQRSGDLRKSATTPPTISQSGRSAVAEFVDTTGYGGFHIEGTLFMPSRDYTYIDDQALEEIDNIYFDWITEGF